MSRSKFRLLQHVISSKDPAYLAVKEDITFNKYLFEQSEKDSNDKIQAAFDAYITKRINFGPYYFLKLLSVFSHTRLKQYTAVPLLLSQICARFPEEKQNIFDLINTGIEYKNTFAFLLQPDLTPKPIFKGSIYFAYFANDDIDSFMRNENVNITIRIPESLSPYLLNARTLTAVEACCYFGAINCFKYAILNKASLGVESFKLALCGGNLEICQILVSIDKWIFHQSPEPIIFNRYEITDWILSQYEGSKMETTMYQCFTSCNWLAAVFYMYTNLPLFVCDMSTFTPPGIFGAAEIGHIEFLAYIVKTYNLSNDDRNEINQASILHSMAQHGQVEALGYFITKLHYDPNVKSYNGFTPLHSACYYGAISVVKYLIETVKVNKEEPEIWERTPFLVAIKGGSMPVITYLAETANVNIHATDELKQDALIIATWHGNLEIVKYLIEKLKFNVNIQDKNGWSPLHLAAQENYFNVCEYLLQHGANRNLLNKNEQKPSNLTTEAHIASLIECF